MFVLLMEEISEVHRWDDLRWQGILMTFDDDTFRHSSNIKAEDFYLLEYNAV
jgi:hypothetical protein